MTQAMGGGNLVPGGTRRALYGGMQLRQDTLKYRLRSAKPMIRMQIIAEQAMSTVAKEREALAFALGGDTSALGGRSAIGHLARDKDEDVRAAAVKTATMNVSNKESYQKVLRRACVDSSNKVRHVAMKGLRKGIHLGFVENVSRALIQCARSSDLETQEPALDAIDDLAHVHPPSAFAVYRALISSPSKLSPRVLPRLQAHLEILEDLFPIRARTLSTSLRQYTMDRSTP
jgi:hypothetical protein